MGQALDEFNLRLTELRADLRLLESTFELRPRICQVLDFEKRGEVLDLARRFAALAGSQPASFYGPMLVRLVASFERYLRYLIRDTVEDWAKKANTFEALPDGLGGRNLVLSGKAIAYSDSPREHLSIDLVELVDNLATCRQGSKAFKLNSFAFMTQITGVTPEIIEKALGLVQVTHWWSGVGADKALQTQLTCTRTPDTTKKAIERLKELSRWRNNWAHGGDDEVTLTGVEVMDALEFLSAFSKALDTAVAKQVKAK